MKLYLLTRKTLRILRKYGLKGIQGKDSKLHTYKGDNGNDKLNLLVDTTMDNKTNKVKYIRSFITNKPNEKWTADVSKFRMASGKIYLSPILDMYDNSIISYDISTKTNFEQTKRIQNKTFKKYKNIDG